MFDFTIDWTSANATAWTVNIDPTAPAKTTIEPSAIVKREQDRIAEKVAALGETLSQPTEVKKLKRELDAVSPDALKTMRQTLAADYPWLDVNSLTKGYIQSVSLRVNHLLDIQDEDAVALLDTECGDTLKNVAVHRGQGANRFTDICNDPIVLAIKGMIDKLLSERVAGKDWMTTDAFMEFLSTIGGKKASDKLKTRFTPLTRNAANSPEVTSWFCTKTGYIHDVLGGLAYLTTQG